MSARKSIFYIIIVYGFLLVTPLCLYAASPAELVSKGNTSYLAGKYDEAISAYDEAAAKVPESPYIYFNKGAALYKKGDYAAAASAFEKAALKSKDATFESKSKFNLGNSFFKEAEHQKNSDPNKALETLDKSIRNYQDALELNPGFKEAAENIEVTRLVMKNILDEINKQKQEAQKQQEAMKQTEDKIKELLRKQQDALNRSQHLEDERTSKGDSEELRSQAHDLADYQKEIQNHTEELAKNLPNKNDKNLQETANSTEKHLNNAATQQKEASDNLEQYLTKEARTNQENAVKELKDALASIHNKQNSGGQQKQEQAQQQSQQQEQQKQKQVSPSGVPSQDKKNHEPKQAARIQQPDSVNEILMEEKENQQQRRVVPQGAYKDVEKDW